MKRDVRFIEAENLKTKQLVLCQRTILKARHINLIELEGGIEGMTSFVFSPHWSDVPVSTLEEWPEWDPTAVSPFDKDRPPR